ncbi:hypothetical protein DACRYDRAFT_102105 [Dacryopinax primogenitus]|uniref:Uncharacterized protein n=1 Tax=Dacryopinax primogenitus (strain DJM 731) TaxID=1858805 RepID=M5FP75_DACPD|nr:uncharacterized protein DACRYDRAFT_102105 [Dacryopinax primogenitus]EJT98290.1 hypothetical protein DACRYDRAFT_102105 [Dacryopinax primogenitus]
MGLDIIHVPRTAGHHLKRVVKRSDCASGGLYVSPTAGQSVSPSSNVNITWDNTCLGSPTPPLVDIYVYAPASATPLIHVWGNVPASTGTYSDMINPSWWNATAGSTESLQLLIVGAGQPSWMTSSPSGPIFTVATPSNYNASATAAAAATSGGSSSSSNNSGSSSSGNNSIYESVTQLLEKVFPKGAIAAAVLIPIIVLVAAAIIYIKWSRKKEAKKRERFSQAIDKRMSVISTDWRPSTTAGARASIAVGAHRGSLATSVYLPRPSSTFATEGGQAGLGAYNGEMSEKAIPRPSFQTQTSLGVPSSQTTRVSRISFAPTVHPRISMAAKDVLGTSDEEDEGAMSPTQLQGPTLLADDDVARASMDENFRAEVLQMPAMTMMRTGRQSIHVPQTVDMGYEQLTGDYRSPSPTSAGTVVPSVSTTMSPLTGFFPASSPSPTTTMSPDDQLRAYAARRAASPLPPQPAAVGSHPGMRVLYDPSAHQQAAQMPNMATLLSPTQPLTISQNSSNRLSVMTTNPNRLSVATNNPFRQSTISQGESVGSRYSHAEVNHDVEAHEHVLVEEEEPIPHGSAL